MGAFRRRPDRHETNRDKVLDSLEASGLDRKTTLILGGAALALLDIRSAEDVDVMVPGEVFEDLRASKRTPGGLYTIDKDSAKHPFLEARSTPMHRTPLVLDVTHPHGPSNRPHSQLDARFLDELRAFDKVEGYPVLPLHAIVAHKRELRRSKDRKDIELIQRYQADKGHRS